MIILRFVRHDDLLTKAILLQTGGQFAHAEALTPENTYIGAYAEGGVQERPRLYDAGRFEEEQFLLLVADSAASAKFYHYLRDPNVLGEKYGFADIVEFVTHLRTHQGHHVVCSALQALALRACEYLPRPLPLAAHEISPVILQLGLLMRPDVREITSSDPWLIAHIKPTGV